MFFVVFLFVALVISLFALWFSQLPMGPAGRVAAEAGSEVERQPVVIVPGLGGSIIDAEWNWHGHKPIYCQNTSHGRYEQVWPIPAAALPWERECWARLVQTDIKSGGTRITNARDHYVRTEPRQFGGLDGINVLYSLDWGLLDMHIVDYFQSTIKHLQGRGINEIYGAPYDFRLVPDPVELDKYFEKLKALIESIGVPVSIIAHSLGTATTVVFLNRQTKAWRKKHIRRYVSVAGPYGGATKAVHACLTGDTETPIRLPADLTDFYRQLEMRFGGVLWMFNNPWVFGRDSVVTAHHDSYNSTQLGNALRRRGATDSAAAYEALVRPLQLSMLTYPGVETHLVHGSGIKTMLRLHYVHADMRDTPHVHYDHDGDGTVPALSLHAVDSWPVASKTSIRGASHLEILNKHEFHRALDRIFGFS